MHVESSVHCTAIEEGVSRLIDCRVEDTEIAIVDISEISLIINTTHCFFRQVGRR